jgi:hypothetical protein
MLGCNHGWQVHHHILAKAVQVISKGEKKEELEGIWMRNPLK